MKKILFLKKYCIILASLVLAISQIKAETNCTCQSQNDNSYYCVNFGKIYDRSDCQQFRFTGMNVHAMTRLDHWEKGEVLKAARAMGITVIRFIGADGSKTNSEAIESIKDVLNHEEVGDMKFIIALTNLYGNGSDADIDANGNAYDPYCPQDDIGSYTGTSHADNLRGEWFNWSHPTYSYRLNYLPWVQAVTTDPTIKNNPKIFAFELGNELKNSSPAGITNTNQVKEFSYYMIGIIKANSPLNLVTTGNLSTWHALNGNTNSVQVNGYLNWVYKNPDLNHRADFVSIHNYDNYWTATDPYETWHRTNLDRIYAKNNLLPWVLGEFGFSGPNFCPNGAYPGGCWDNVPGEVPGPIDLYDVWIPNCASNRACAINLGLQVYISAGASGIMGWGFNPIDDYDRGISGDKCRGFDILFDPEYEETKEKWMIASGQLNDAFIYECQEDMDLNADPYVGLKNIICKAENLLTVSHKINSTFDINYVSGNSIELMPDANTGAGFEAGIGSNANAFIAPTSCFDCNYIECPPFSNVQVQDLPNQDSELKSMEKSSTSEQIELKVFPVPFQHTTTLSYHLNTETKLSLHVYDVMGNLVQELIPLQLQDAGQYQVPFGKNLPNGVYLCQLKVNDLVKTLRIIKSDF